MYIPVEREVGREYFWFEDNREPEGLENLPNSVAESRRDRVRCRQYAQ